MPEQAGRTVVLAAGAHPDDVEFMMAGTLLLLARAGAGAHMWSVSDGGLGAVSAPRSETAARRFEESKRSARIAGAVLHVPIAPDMGVTYEAATVARAAAVIRRVRPSIILLPSPEDYHPDHEATSMVLTAAAFARGFAAFETEPAEPPWDGDTTLYHALPFGLRDGMRRLVRAGLYVDTSGVMEEKRDMLASYESQREWLLASQGADYMRTMEEMSLQVGRASGSFLHAEGFRRHSHLGFCVPEADPLTELLGSLCITDESYEASLEA